MDSVLSASLIFLTGRGVFLDTLIILFAGYWEYVIVALLLLYLLRKKESKEEKHKNAKIVGWAIVSAAIARLGVVNLIRFFYGRERPFVFEQFTPLIEHVSNAAFPSGHAAFFMALAVYFLLTKQKNFGWLLFVSAILMGIGRVAAGIHWPTDIIAGWAIGALVTFVVWYFTQRREKINISLKTD